MVAIGPGRLAFALFFSAVLSYGAYHRRSLSISGAAAAFVVGLCHALVGYVPTAALMMFFLTSSILTRVGGKKKSKVEDGHKEGGQRDFVQVLSNGGPSTIVCALYLAFYGPIEHSIDFIFYPQQSLMLVSLIAAYAAANGDTWSSELGILLAAPPRLVTSCRHVPAGTNGGISLLGLAVTPLAGFLVGLAAFIPLSFLFDGHYASQWPVLIVGAAAGLVGSLVDSLMGALFQYSGWDDRQKRIVNSPTPSSKWVSGRAWLDNNEVNLLSIIVTALLAVPSAPTAFRLGTYA